MRPAYRYSLIVAALLALGAVAAWSMRPSAPEAAPVAPTTAAPPRVRAPARVPEDLREIPRALDRLHQAELEQLGPERAAARRRQRERLILERGGALPDPEVLPDAPAPP